MQGFIFWVVIVIILSILEVSTINLVSVWFIVSALASLVISFFIDSFFIQFLVFVILGIILLITTKPIINKYLLNNRKTKPSYLIVRGLIFIIKLCFVF